MIAVMMLPSLAKIGVLIDFKINQDFIVEVLCVNKDKPMVMCGGMCYLTAQLEEIDDQEGSQAPTQNQERVEVVYFYFSGPNEFIPRPDDYSYTLNAAYKSEFHSSAFVVDIFHPPQVG